MSAQIVLSTLALAESLTLFVVSHEPGQLAVMQFCTRDRES